MKPLPRPLPSAIELAEESVQLLRQAGAGCWLLYLAGAVPFWSAVLRLWAATPREAPSAADDIAWAALLAVLYIGMKTLHARFCQALAGERLQTSRVPLRPKDWFALSLVQLRTQPWALGAFWAGLCTLIPWPWALAYGQSLSVLAGEAHPVRAAAAEAGREPRQIALAALLWLALLAVLFVNAYTACIMLPWLAAHLLGWSDRISTGAMGLLNPTYAGMALVAAWMALDPLLKAFYTLRAFYARSVATGEDLSLAWTVARRRRASVAGALAIFCLAAVSANAQPAPPSAPPVSPEAVMRALSQAQAQPAYAWTRPGPEAAQDAGHSAVQRWLKSFVEGVRRDWNRIDRQFERAWRWLQGDTDPASQAGLRRPQRGAAVMHLFILAGGIAVVALALLIVAQIRAGRASVAARTNRFTADPGEDPAEAMDASKLPPAGWLDLAADLARRGEWRAALRAAYLATLARLAAQQLIGLARGKTNLDYERELRRRASARPDLIERFSARRRRFDAVWYGPETAREDEVQSWIAQLREDAGS